MNNNASHLHKSYSDKIRNSFSLPRSLSVWLAFSLKWPHTRSLTSAVLSAKSPDSLSRLWKTAQVLFTSKMLAKTSMRLWTLHAQSTTTQYCPRLIYSQQPRLSTECLCYIAGLWDVIMKSIKYPISCFFFPNQVVEFSLLPAFRICVPTY